MIDLHSHILHETDDGSRNLEESLSMIKSAWELGFRGIVCTSHYKVGRVENEVYEERFQKLKKTLEEKEIEIGIYRGNEMFLSQEEMERLKEGKINTYNGTKYLLIELDPAMSYLPVKAALERIIALGYKPVLAHIERYRELKMKHFRELKNMGIPLQMNIVSMGNGHRETVLRYLDGKLVDLFTSDAHRSDKRSYLLKKELEELREYAGELHFSRMVENSYRIIRGEEVDLGMGEKGKVSIITPAYNSEKHIGETIESIQAQTYKNWELLVTDDGSTDKTAEIVKSYQEKDSRIKLFLQGENGGVAHARNRSLREVTGQYVAFLDSNDLWLPEKLEKQIEFMKEKKAYITYTGYYNCNEEGEIRNTVEIPEILTYEKALGGNKMGCLTVMIDATKISTIKMINVNQEDYATWLHILKQGYQAYGLNQPLAKYRVLEGSLSGDKRKAMVWHWNIYRKCEGMGLISSLYYFTKYAFHGVLKRYGKSI